MKRILLSVLATLVLLGLTACDSSKPTKISDEDVKPTTSASTQESDISVKDTVDIRFADEDGNEWDLSGEVQSAQAMWEYDDTSGHSNPIVSVTFTEVGAQKFAEATSKNLYKTLSLYIDGELIVSPTVNMSITIGEVVIRTEDYETAERIASLLRGEEIA